jgi:hypothetical protein
MEATILVGIIGAICTLVSPVIALIIKEQMNKRPLIKLSVNRQKALEGTWRANICQELRAKNAPEKFSASLQIEINRKTVSGRFAYDSKRGPNTLLMKGGFHNDRFLKMEYYNESPHIVQFGLFILELSSDALLLQGRFLGFGAESEIFVAGTITAKKIRI